jgi:gluconate kinase
VRTLEHVLWIGGKPASGKSSVAARIMRRYGLRSYSADTRTWQHRDRAIRAANAAARRWEAMTPEERWVKSTPHEMLDMALHRERGQMVIDDLRELPDSPLVIADGTTLPARALSSGIAERSRAVWLLPTNEFQRARLDERDLASGPRALYHLLGETIEQEAKEHGARTLTVDISHSLEETVAAVKEMFADALAAGPRAESLAERPPARKLGTPRLHPGRVRLARERARLLHV